jgi:hypothetical protein
MKKILVLSLVSIMALAVLGVGYATWQKVLFIDGTVSTGNVDVYWTTDIGYSSEGDIKQISTGSCVVEGDTLVFKVATAYPSVWYRCDFDVHSAGSIPVHLAPIEILSPMDPCADFQITEPVTASGSNQLHQGDTAWGSIVVHLDNSCRQSTDLGFLLRMIAHQYNLPPEVPGP